ncbi:MAG TPA: hypothetical protein VHS97_23780 [Isosphaeraceae bacterium]|nr:hypothetical protein [Isosphaeraceae bacterium]
MLQTDQGEQVPGAVGEHRAVDFGVVLNCDQKVVERFLGPALRQRGERVLGGVHVLGSHPLAQGLAPHTPWGERHRCDRTQNLVASSTALLDAAGVAIKDFQDGQRPRGLRQLAAHVKRRCHRHHRVKADIIFTAERPGVGKRSRRDQPLQFDPTLQFVDHDGHETLRGRLLHDRDQAFQLPEVQTRLRTVDPRAGQSEVSGGARTERRDQSPSSHVREKLSSVSLGTHGDLLPSG